MMMIIIMILMMLTSNILIQYNYDDHDADDHSIYFSNMMY